MNRPEVVSEAAWQEAHEALLAKEKALMRERDALAAERRRQPMVRIEKDYAFEGPAGRLSLADLFEGRTQLAIYNFMLAPQSEPCDGCASVVDMFGFAEHANLKDLTLAIVSRAPLDEIDAVKQRMGWDYPWYSSGIGDWNEDNGFSTERGERFGLTMFLRDGDEVFKTWATSGRGVEAMSALALVDMAPYGRQEDWEDSPEGWPQMPRYSLPGLREEFPPEPMVPSYTGRTSG